MPPFGIPTVPQPKDEGGSLPRRPYTDYVGAGVTATDDATNNRTIVTIPGGGTVSVQDEAIALTSRGALNFTGNGVTATDDPANNRTQIFIPGAVGGTTNYPATILTPSGGDDSPQLQAAFTATSNAGGGEILINGMLRLKTRCNYLGQNLLLRGAGWGVKSGFQPFDASYNGISFMSMGNPDPAVDSGIWNKVQNLYFGYVSGTKTGGAAIEMNCSYSEISDCIFNAQYECISITAGQIHIIRNCQFWGFAGDGIRCRAADGTYANPMRGNEYRIHDCLFWGSGSAVGSGKAAINWEWLDPLYLFNTEIMMADIGIKISNPGSGNPYATFSGSYDATEWGWISNCVVDEYGTAGILIDGSTGFTRNLYLRDNYVSTYGAKGAGAGGPGIRILGAGASKVQISGGVITGSSMTTGIAVERGVANDPSDIHIKDLDNRHGISFASGGTYNGIEVIGCYNGSPGWTCNFDLGNATFTNSRFVGNRLDSYINTSGLINSASRTSIVQGNLNWQPVAVIPSVPSSGVAINNPNPFNCTVYISSGSVSAIIVNGITTGLTGGAVHVPQGGTIQLTYSAAPSWTWIADK